MTNIDETILTRRSVYNGAFIKLEHLTVRLPDGEESSRDVVRHPGATAIVAVDSEGRVCMVEQYRTALEKVMLEIPAGKLDPDEPPEVCARRELEEETGLACGQLIWLSTLASTPGFTDEWLHLYLALDLIQGETHADADEFINSRFIPMTELLGRVTTGQISDMKTVAGLLLAAAKLHIAP